MMNNDILNSPSMRALDSLFLNESKSIINDTFVARKRLSFQLITETDSTEKVSIITRIIDYIIKKIRQFYNNLRNRFKSMRGVLTPKTHSYKNFSKVDKIFILENLLDPKVDINLLIMEMESMVSEIDKIKNKISPSSKLPDKKLRLFGDESTSEIVDNAIKHVLKENVGNDAVKITELIYGKPVEVDSDYLMVNQSKIKPTYERLISIPDKLSEIGLNLESTIRDTKAKLIAYMNRYANDNEKVSEVNKWVAYCSKLAEVVMILSNIITMVITKPSAIIYDIHMKLK